MPVNACLLSMRRARREASTDGGDSRRFELLQCAACSLGGAIVTLKAPHGVGRKRGALLSVQEEFAELLLEFRGVADLRGAALSHELSGQ